MWNEFINIIIHPNYGLTGITSEMEHIATLWHTFTPLTKLACKHATVYGRLTGVRGSLLRSAAKLAIAIK